MNTKNDYLTRLQKQVAKQNTKYIAMGSTKRVLIGHFGPVEDK